MKFILLFFLSLFCSPVFAFLGSTTPIQPKETEAEAILADETTWATNQNEIAQSKAEMTELRLTATRKMAELHAIERMMRDPNSDNKDRRFGQQAATRLRSEVTSLKNRLSAAEKNYSSACNSQVMAGVNSYYKADAEQISQNKTKGFVCKNGETLAEMSTKGRPYTACDVMGGNAYGYGGGMGMMGGGFGMGGYGCAGGYGMGGTPPQVEKVLTCLDNKGKMTAYGQVVAGSPLIYSTRIHHEGQNVSKIESKWGAETTQTIEFKGDKTLTKTFSNGNVISTCENKGDMMGGSPTRSAPQPWGSSSGRQ